jgi:hypothetical protein
MSCLRDRLILIFFLMEMYLIICLTLSISAACGLTGENSQLNWEG